MPPCSWCTMWHSVPRKLRVSFLRWQNNPHKALAIGAHSLSRPCTLSQVGLSSKQQFVSRLGWKDAFSPTNSFDELSYHSSHIHKGKKKIHLQSTVSQLQHLKGRLPFPLAKTYEHKNCCSHKTRGKKYTIKLEISKGLNLSRASRQSSLTARDQIKILISSLENWCSHLELTRSSSSLLFHPLSRKLPCQNIH